MPNARPRIRLATVITAMTYGGAQRILADFLTRLPPGFDPEVICLYPGPMVALLRERGIPTTEHNFRGWRTIFAVLPLWRHFRRTRPHIVHTHLGKADFCGRLAARLAGVPIVITTSHNSEHWKKNALLNAIDNWSLGMADAILAVSAEVKRFLVERGVAEAKVRVSYARAELRERFAEPELDPAKAAALRAELGVPEGALLSIMVGRMHPQKAHEIALRAMAELPASAAPHFLLLAGEGPLRAAHEEEARRLGLADRVRFLGNRADVPDLLRLANVFVMPSRWEGAPLALMEAHGAGLPAVVSDIPSMSEVVADCRGALVARFDDPADFAAKWAQLLADGGLRREIGDRARARALEHWDITTLAGEWVAVYEELLESKGITGDVQ